MQNLKDRKRVQSSVNKVRNMNLEEVEFMISAVSNVGLKPKIYEEEVDMLDLGKGRYSELRRIGLID